MAYFNHAFRKTFLATGGSVTTEDVTLIDGTAATVTSDGGYVYETTTPVAFPTYGLNVLSAAQEAINGSYASGYFGLFEPRTNNLYSISNQEGTNCCPLYFAGSAIYANDKIGPFAGGYTETNKSKVVNPRYVSRFYSVEPCAPQNEVLHVGSTYWTSGTGVATLNVAGLPDGTGYTNGTYAATTTSVTGSGLVLEITVAGNIVTGATIIAPGKGYAVGDSVTIDGGNDDAAVIVATLIPAGVDPITGSGGDSCCKPFLCGETYNLRLDIKGSPALRYLNHNAYYTASFYTGCCPADALAPVPVDSTLVMIGWADLILRSPIVNPFVQIAVQDQTGVLWYAPGTSAAFLAANGADTWNHYNDGVNHTSPGYIEGACAGLIFNGAYVDTRFGDCTFQISDFYEKEPVRLYVSEMDLNGDPCTFDGICVVHECLGRQVNGLGETVLRDVILSESYRQNFVATDFRIREITQGNQIISAIDRGALYWAYYLQHNVPRHNNPTGTFDADQYLLQFVSENQMSQFEVDMTSWLVDCGVCEFEAIECVTSCEPLMVFPPVTAATNRFI